MALRSIGLSASTVALAFTLSACGGGGASGGGINSTPTPIRAPTPTTTPTPAPMPPPFGLTSSQQFATYGVVNGSDAGKYSVDPVSPDVIKFNWSAEAKAYEVTLPGFAPGRLERTFPGNNDLAFHATDASGNRLPLALTVLGPKDGLLDFTYSSLAFYQTHPSGATEPFISATFAYGIPTPASDVPTSGTATYEAVVRGFTGEVGYEITGDARLSFDFSASSLSGYMRPRLFSDWGGVDHELGQYDFTQTIVARGGNGFSGKFAVPNGPSDSVFDGRFTGPKAVELIAGWRAPYLDPFDNTWKTMGGFWIGKKQ